MRGAAGGSEETASGQGRPEGQRPAQGRRRHEEQRPAPGRGRHEGQRPAPVARRVTCFFDFSLFQQSRSFEHSPHRHHHIIVKILTKKVFQQVSKINFILCYKKDHIVQHQRWPLKYVIKLNNCSTPSSV